MLPGASGVVAVFGPGLGSFVIALGRCAERVVAIVPDPLERSALEGALAEGGIDRVELAESYRPAVDARSQVFDLVVCASEVLSSRQLVDMLAPEGLALVRMAGPLPVALIADCGAARHATRERTTRSRLAAAGLGTRWLFPLPLGVAPAITVDGADWRTGFAFYMRHLYPASSTGRRIGGRLLVAAPTAVVRALAPNRWLLAGRPPGPCPVPSTIVGTPLAGGEIKVVDWDAATVTGALRSTGQRVRIEALAPGWSAESWTTWPLRAGARDRRRTQLLDALGPVLADGHAGVEDAEVTRGCLAQARAGLLAVDAVICADTAAWCRDLVERVAARSPVPQAPEHGDLQLRNLIVEPAGAVEAIDRPYEMETALAGSDVTRVLVDLLCRSAGEPGFDLALAVEALDRARAGLRAAIGRFLITALGQRDPAALADAMAFAVLRDARNGPVGGLGAFVHLAATGRLEAVLRRAVSVA